MDIHSSAPWPSRALSNFCYHHFTFDGVGVKSMEGLLQSFKFRDIARQRQLCFMRGYDAKFVTVRRSDWRKAQVLHWNGVDYPRHGPEYQDLLTRAYQMLATVTGFRDALLATGSEPLTHTIGNPDPRVTVLTEEEFCSRLLRIRLVLQSRRST